MEAAAHASRSLRALESVCCLECGEIYSKPLAGSTAQKNPGCPHCSYVGWIPLSLPAEPAAPCRFAEGRPPLHGARSR